MTNIKIIKGTGPLATISPKPETMRSPETALLPKLLAVLGVACSIGRFCTRWWEDFIEFRDTTTREFYFLLKFHHISQCSAPDFPQSIFA
jgi:hypothetical protein